MSSNIMKTIENMRKNTKSAYTMIAEMGGVLPESKNLENLSSSIVTITHGSGDGTPWGTLYTTQHPEGIVLNSVYDYVALGNPADIPSAKLNFSFGVITKTEITGYSFGTGCTFAPDDFCRSLPNLVRFEHTDVLQTIGQSFLYSSQVSGHTFNQPILLPNVHSIGDSFLRKQEAFNSEVRLGNSLQVIGDNFMDDNFSFAQDLTIPSSVVTVGSNFMFRPNNFTGILTIMTSAIPNAGAAQDSLCTSDELDPAYRQGIRITGLGAAAWKAALPDRNGSDGTNRRRKLILV